MSAGGTTRREFVATGSKLALGAMIVPRHVLGGRGFRAPSDTLNIAIVGAGGMGGQNATQLGSENIVAVCDVDFDYVARSVEDKTRDGDGNPRPEGVRWKEQYERAAKYHDFREMLASERSLDAVLIATPDHAHAPIAKACMQAGKHVYVQKPLTWSVEEARMLRDLAAETGVVTQMGNQGHSMDDGRLVLEWIDAGIIGPVRERPVDGLPPDLPSVSLARLDGVRRRGARRHGRALARSPVLGARARLSDARRGLLDPVGRPVRRPRMLPGRDDGALPVPGARRPAARRPPLVRRWPDAPASGRTP